MTTVTTGFRMPTPSQPAPPSPPLAPTGLAATASSTTTAALTWNVGSDPGGPGIGSYGVYELTLGFIQYVPSHSFTVTGLNPATTYTFTVTARDINFLEGLPSLPSVVTTPSAGCAQQLSSTVFTQAGDQFAFINSPSNPNFVIQFDNWGPMPGTIKQWINDFNCWGVTNVSRHTEQGSVACYPDVSRGWSFNDNVMAQKPGNTYTTSVGMGVQVSALTGALVSWNIQQVPNVPGQSRWDALIDVYLHQVATPAFTVTPFVDISIFQMVMDANYYGPTYASEHGCPITIGGVQYAVIVDESDGFNNFNAPGGHYILMLCRPSAPNDGLAPNSLWGQQNVTHDLKAILAYWGQSNPIDDNGNPVKNGHTGVVVTSPLVSSALFLTSVNAGYEIDFTASTADSWVTGGYNVLMQGEVPSALSNGQSLTVTPPGGALTAFAAKATNIPDVWDNGQDGPGVASPQWSGAWPNACSDANYNLKNRAAPFTDSGFVGGSGVTIQAPTPYTQNFLGGNHHDKTAGNTGFQVIQWLQYATPAFPWGEVWDYYYRVSPLFGFDLGGWDTDTHDNNFKFDQISQGTGGPASSPTQNGYRNYTGGLAGDGPRNNADTGLTFNCNSGPGFTVGPGNGWLVSPDQTGKTHFNWWQPNHNINLANPSTTFGTQPAGWVHEQRIYQFTDQTNGFWRVYQNGVLVWSYSGPVGFQGISAQSNGIGGYCRNQGALPSGTGVASAGTPGTFTQWRFSGNHYVDISGNLARFELTNSGTYGGAGSGVQYEPQPYTAWATGSVTVKVNKGNLSAGPASLWYIDEMNGITTPILVKQVTLA